MVEGRQSLPVLLCYSSLSRSRAAPLTTALKCHGASSAAPSSHSSLYKQGQQRGHAYTSHSVILLLCPACHLQTHYHLSLLSLATTATASLPIATSASFEHNHSMMPVVITVGHNFRDNLRTINYPWSIKRE